MFNEYASSAESRRDRGEDPAPGRRDPASASRAESLGNDYEITAPPLQDQVLWRLSRYRLQAYGRDIIPEHRIRVCLRNLRPGEHKVQVWKSKEKAHYKGLQVCGSVWVCPVCAAKISERRRVEMLQGIETWRKVKGAVLMSTLTVPHYAGQPLAQLLESFNNARRLMRHRKPWKKLAKLIGLAGTVRALEVTWGQNGWHVHCHEILFLAPGLEVDPLGVQNSIYQMWRDACKTAGLGEPNFRRGVQVHDGQEAGKYATKWGMDSELTKGHIKRARGEGNFAPFDMLREYGEGREEFVDLFREYARAFHGKRQLVWSDGLRGLLGLGAEASDAELAARIEADAAFLGALDRAHWVLVKRAEKRGELLEIAAARGWQGVLEFISKLI